jgi:ribosomal protein L7/L12
VREELEQFGLNHLKEYVANANNKFLETSARNDADDLRQFQEQEATRKQLEELRAKLKFD